MIKWLVPFLALFFVNSVAVGQPDLSAFPKKGSYLYYGQPAFEDNSFLLEEAFNQSKGVHQFISTFYWNSLNVGDFTYSFTHEIPLIPLRHQLSYTFLYNVWQKPESVEKTNGFGDVSISYRPMLWGDKDWAMVIPRFTLIVPTGDAIKGNGTGGWGAQFNLAVTKRLSRKVITHYNAGYTFISKADRYTSNSDGNNVLAFEKDLRFKNLGASVIWYPTRKFNLLLEYTSNFLNDIEEDGSLSRSHQYTFNPGFRFCIDYNLVQIVPGAGIPLNFVDGKFSGTGVFLYLSVEPQYLPFNKAKSR